MFRDILVHLDGGSRDGLRIEIALNIAAQHQGRVTGLFARSERLMSNIVARKASDKLQEAAAQSERQFNTLTADSDIPCRWWRLSHGEAGHVLHETVLAARVADLVILGQHSEGKNAPEELIEQVLLQAGRPTLIIPHAGDYPTVGQKCMLAWNGGRECTRAVHDALPFLVKADEVEILTIRPNQDQASTEGVPPISISDHLDFHGVKITREVLAGDDIGIMDLLLSRGFDMGCDLLVMGAHGGYNLPFFKGAGTRHILKHMTLPVLMAH